jgi:hypothetical protein
VSRGETPESDFGAERAELEAVLASDVFSRSPTIAQMLKYICEQHFGGQGQDVKEYNIAVEAFGRPPDFDQSRDSIVRVEAHRLRKRLQEYYGGAGADHQIQIVVPAGSYIPQFVRRSGAVQPPSASEAVAIPEAVAAFSEFPANPVGAESAPPAVELPASETPRSRPWMPYALAALALAIAIPSFLWVRHARQKSAPVSQAAPAPVPLSPQEEVRILAGFTAGQLVDHYGNTWSGDRYYDGGEERKVPRRHIANTLDSDIFCHWRQGSFSYHIPLRKGAYEMRLYFAEMIYGEDNVAGGGESTRVFKVLANNQELIRYFDVISDASGSNTADIKVFRDIQPGDDGMLHLQFVSSVNNVPFVNAIEIVPSQPGAIRPIRILARDSALTDEKNRLWSADRYFHGGMLVQRHDPVAGAEDEGLYQNERFGNFSYIIPVALGGRYDATLKFCENWIGPDRPRAGGAGTRVFDVLFNGRLLLANFDVFKQVGSLHALDKTFKGLEPNAQGKLVFTFTPIHDYAMVNAIEVVDEAWK